MTNTDDAYALLEELERRVSENASLDVDDVSRLLNADGVDVHLEVLGLLIDRAQDDPGAVVDVVDDLVPHLDSEVVDVRQRASRCVALVACYDPKAVAPFATDLLDVLESEETDTARTTDLSPIKRDTTEFQQQEIQSAMERSRKQTDAVIEQTLTALSALVDAETTSVSGVLADHGDCFVELLDHRWKHVRGQAVGILAHIAEHSPDAVEDATPALIDLLDEEAVFVRGNAIWTLHYLRAERALDRLSQLVEDDDNEEIRELAKQTIAVLDTDDASGGA